MNQYHSPEQPSGSKGSKDNIISGALEKQEFISDFEQKQIILKMWDIEIKEALHPYDIEGTLKDPAIKDKMYTALVKELKDGSSLALEVMVEEGLLSKEDMEARGATQLKEIALGFLKRANGPRRKREQMLFINAGILTAEEVGDHRYKV